MPKVLRRNNLKYSMTFLFGVAVLAALISWQQLAADNSQPAEAALSETVDATVPGTLRIAGRHTYSINVTLASKLEEPVAGPIYLVVEGTGLEGLAVHEPDGLTAADEPYVQLLDGKAKLTLEKPSVEREITFKSSVGALRASERREFELSYRLTREILTPVPEAERPDSRRPGVPRVAIGPGRGGSSRPDGQRGARQTEQSADDNDADEAEPAGKKRPAREPFELKPEINDEEVARVMTLQDEWTPEALKIEGVCGTSTGVNADGDLVIRVYTARHGIADDLPKDVGGVPVEAKVVGRFRPMYQQPQDKRGRARRSGRSGPSSPDVDSPQQRFPLPIPIGVSGFVRRTPSICATGTIGCRLRGADGTLYALSNNHVFAGENNALIGDAILHPGPLDDDCSSSTRNSIGRLAGFVRVQTSTGVFVGLPNASRVDAAIAEVTAATMSNATPRGAYGMPNSHTVRARLGMKVQKMGRTTSFTTGRVTGINVSSLVGPFDGGLAFFVRQIEIINPLIRFDDEGGGTVSFQEFGGPGDSGSLIVTTYGNNPVGLLFAGSGFVTLANSIDLVLDELGDELGQTLTIDGAPSNEVP